MTKRPELLSKRSEKASMRAADVARDMLIDLAGPRDWHATKQSLIARAALRTRLSFRRAKSIIYSEQNLKLSADEYLAIEVAWKSANAALASLSEMARDADVQARALARVGSGVAEASSRPTDRQEYPAADAAVRPAR